MDEYKNVVKIHAERHDTERNSSFDRQFASLENRFEDDQMQQLLRQHVFSPAQLQKLLKNHSFHMQQQQFINNNSFDHQSLNHFKKFDLTRSQFERTMQNLHEQLQMNLLQQTQLLQHKQFSSHKMFLGMILAYSKTLKQNIFTFNLPTIQVTQKKAAAAAATHQRSIFSSSSLCSNKN